MRSFRGAGVGSVEAKIYKTTETKDKALPCAGHPIHNKDHDSVPQHNNTGLEPAMTKML